MASRKMKTSRMMLPARSNESCRGYPLTRTGSESTKKKAIGSCGIRVSSQKPVPREPFTSVTSLVIKQHAAATQIEADGLEEEPDREDERRKHFVRLVYHQVVLLHISEREGGAAGQHLEDHEGQGESAPEDRVEHVEVEKHLQREA
eukprot:752542-Hanusia_phi.AAC.5